jgi:hypothetical protein
MMHKERHDREEMVVEEEEAEGIKTGFKDILDPDYEDHVRWAQDSTQALPRVYHSNRIRNLRRRMRIISSINWISRDS